MHGRPRKTAPNPEEQQASNTKALKLRSLQSLFLTNHQNKIYTQEAIDLSTKLIEINPEAYTAWNYRKLAVQSRIDSDPNLIKTILDQELVVVENALRKNFKSYGAWYHRKWVLSKGESSVENELGLLDKFQKADSRNFHAWNYRRFVVDLTMRSEPDELQYTKGMIDKNFSNYSAWHNRSVILSSLLAQKADGFMPSEKIADEYDLVHQGIFLDPDDQSGWFYHRWLLDQTANVETPRLVSSWPSDGFSIVLPRAESGSYPLVLYFDQAVSGVNSSTVTVDSEFEDIVWEPVSEPVSCVWVARLIYSGAERKEYKVKVRLGSSPGIVSSRGCNFRAPYEFVFTANVQDSVEESQEGIVSWNDGFDTWNSESKDLNSLVDVNRFKGELGFEWRQAALEKEIDLFCELAADIDSKILKLTIARLLMAYETMISDGTVTGTHYKEILQLYNDLMALDSSHYHFYKDEHSVAFLHQVTSSAESLSKYLFRYRDMNNLVCLRLSNLSLSRIATVEKLLFVQMLDLSHNEIHSTEGLEAMQLLTCLNLSHNRIRNFSALDSLRHVKELKVLDISHNHIGKHAVDTTRYLCSSPLSNSENESGKERPSFVTKYWDAYFVLKDMNLKQLDVSDNAISGEEFSSFVRQVVHRPTTKLNRHINLDSLDHFYSCDMFLLNFGFLFHYMRIWTKFPQETTNFITILSLIWKCIKIYIQSKHKYFIILGQSKTKHRRLALSILKCVKKPKLVY